MEDEMKNFTCSLYYIYNVQSICRSVEANSLDIILLT